MKKQIIEMGLRKIKGAVIKKMTSSLFSLMTN